MLLHFKNYFNKVKLNVGRYIIVLLLENLTTGFYTPLNTEHYLDHKICSHV